ncbi:hypothetical protein [Mucilaginibacter ginkgonis]|uniref:Carboxypeptidase-like protein n=1 Tax=Mucilaginibacter ginkgonis TaxID=2682091 RepID=A0A6I4I0F0_9SPHI|nr:hypothetical protein [Mucilaginibacter ginkgonis]QQL49636.1 hypothetical protein GO620_015915 [Mucilaginibacter ginkgonis]
MRKYVLLFCVLCCVFKALAQDKQIDGIIYDTDTKGRIALVNITNLRTKTAVYNSLKAEFHIVARPGDKLAFFKTNYVTDTVTVKSYGPLLVFLKPNSIMLKQVDIFDTMASPKQRLAATKKEYNKVYGSLDTHDYLNVSPYGGAGIGIDAIWNALSRSGRNAAHLRTIIERDYHDNLVDYRFTKTLVANVTGLKEPRLTDFMQKYRPSYYLTMSANDYDYIQAIKINYRRYQRNPRAFTLPKLVTPQPAPKP